MADNETYISDLSQVIEIKPADSFIVETTEGTKRILWQDIIVGQDNVDFYNLITQNEVDILTLSANQVTLSGEVAELTTTVDTLTSDNTLRDQYGWVYVEFDDLGSISSAVSSQNIQSIVAQNVGAGLGAIKVTVPSGTVNFANAQIQLTLNFSVSGNPFNDNVCTLTPAIFERGNDYFIVGANAIFQTLSSTSALQSVSFVSDVQERVVQTGSITTSTPTLSIAGVGQGAVSPQVVSNVSPSTVALNYQGENASVSTTSLTYSYQSIEKLNSGAVLASEDGGNTQGLNIQFRW